MSVGVEAEWKFLGVKGFKAEPTLNGDLPKMLLDLVPQDPYQPGSHRRFAEKAVFAANCSEKRLLNQVFGHMSIVKAGIGVTKEVVGVLLDPISRAADKLSVVDI